jgi:hypothetical protein
VGAGDTARLGLTFGKYRAGSHRQASQSDSAQQVLFHGKLLLSFIGYAWTRKPLLDQFSP